MKSLSLFFVFFGSSLLAHAGEDLTAQIFPLNPEIRFERSADQDMVQRKPQTLALGLRKGSFSGLFESSQFSDESGNATLAVKRSLQSFLVWGRLHYFRQENATMDLSLYGGAGVGTYQESVTTNFSGVQTKDVGAQSLATGLSLGVDTAFRVYKSFAFITAFEARLLFGKDFDPNPQVSGLWRIGIQF